MPTSYNKNPLTISLTFFVSILRGIAEKWEVERRMAIKGAFRTQSSIRDGDFC